MCGRRRYAAARARPTGPVRGGAGAPGHLMTQNETADLRLRRRLLLLLLLILLLPLLLVPIRVRVRVRLLLLVLVLVPVLVVLFTPILPFLGGPLITGG